MAKLYEGSTRVYLAKDNPHKFIKELKKFPESILFVIYYGGSKWNDFGFNTNFKFKIFYNLEEIYDDSIKFSFLEEPYRLFRKFDEIFINKQANIIDSKDSPKFFTMLNDMRAYRNFVDFFTPSESTAILSAANDIICQKILSFSESWYEEALNTKVFNRSFIRSGQAYFTFHNAQHVLNGSEYKSIEKIQGDFTANFKIEGTENDYSIDFKFHDSALLPNRMSVMIGNNGAGKSRSFHNIASSLLDDDERFRDKDGGRPKLSRLICISSPSELSKTFPRYRSRPRLPYLKIANGRGGRFNLWPCEQIIRLLRLEDKFIRGDRWNLFTNAIYKEFNLSELALPFKKNVENEEYDIGQKYILFKDLENFREERGLETYEKIDKKSDPVRVVNDKIFPMSSGEVSFINLISTLCLHIENGSLILLDEPENFTFILI